jgi:hypothetical protein
MLSVLDDKVGRRSTAAAKSTLERAPINRRRTHCGADVEKSRDLSSNGGGRGGGGAAGAVVVALAGGEDVGGRCSSWSPGAWRGGRDDNRSVLGQLRR